MDLGETTRVDRAVIDEGDWNRVREFELQVQQDGVWKTIAVGHDDWPGKGDFVFTRVGARLPAEHA